MVEHPQIKVNSNLLCQSVVHISQDSKSVHDAAAASYSSVDFVFHRLCKQRDRNWFRPPLSFVRARMDIFHTSGHFARKLSVTLLRKPQTAHSEDKGNFRLLHSLPKHCNCTLSYRRSVRSAASFCQLSVQMSGQSCWGSWK